MKQALVALAIAALALPASALGKGPSAASIDGPGTGGGIPISSEGQGPTPLGELTTESGLYLQMWGEEHGQTLIPRPTGDLGPKYTITWTVPGPSNGIIWKLRQEVYPYATPAPVTYMAPGQNVFDYKTHGGWFQADASLKQTLVAAGLPSTAPSTGSSGSTGFPTTLASLVTAFLLVALVTALLIRRRVHPVAA